MVLHEVSLDVPNRQVVALLGHNGAGKSTLLKAIGGQIPVWSGTVLFNGQPRSWKDSATSALQGIRYVPQEGNTFPNLTVRDNLRLGAYSINPSPEVLAERTAEVVKLFPQLENLLSRPARLLSGGERQMLAIAMALMTNPRFLMLDEPSAGLAPILVQRLFDAIVRLQAEQGLTVLLVEQNVNEALRLASTAYVMQEGRIVFNAPSSDREQIIHHLWGLSRAG